MTESLWQQSKVNCPKNQTDSDPIPTWLLKVCASVLTHTITNIVNLSLTSGQFHHILKESVMSPLLKKPTLDKDQLSNYRPISNLSHIQNNRTCCKMSTYWSPCLQWSSQSSPVCLLPASLHWNSPTVYPWSSVLINAIGSQKLSCLPPWSVCRFRHHRPQHPNHPPVILVWNSRFCLELVQVLPNIPFFSR